MVVSSRSNGAHKAQNLPELSARFFQVLMPRANVQVTYCGGILGLEQVF